MVPIKKSIEFPLKKIYKKLDICVEEIAFKKCVSIVIITQKILNENMFFFTKCHYLYLLLLKIPQK